MRLALVSIASVAALAGCSAVPPADMPALAQVSHVDLPRYMGDWYVIACIPTFVEAHAWNEVESYRLDADGSIPTHLRFNDGATGGPLKEHDSRAFVQEGSGNAVWGEQYVWPFKADYRIAWLAPDYGEVVVAREKRDYVWIMARTPTIPDADLARLTAFVGTQGYDVAKLRRVPQEVGR